MPPALKPHAGDATVPLPDKRRDAQRIVSRLPHLLAVLLIAGTWAVFWPVADHAFLNFDDPHYVVGNAEVRGGLTWRSVAWAFTTRHAANWHPLTWLSHMLDCQLFGLQAGIHHQVNVLFHAANVLLLFGVLRRMTGALWRSAMVAALFALHPLHVESVAWVAERKDVLSTLFWLLTLGAYARYVSASRPEVRGTCRKSQICGTKAPLSLGSDSRTRRATLWYVITLILFALGLLAKPMLVTLPFVLLLLDYWPLERMKRARGLPGRNLWKLSVEKTPFFALSAASCAVTFWAQESGGAVVTGEELPLTSRIANALVSYTRYLGKTIWPDPLAVYYVHPKAWPALTVCICGLVLLTLTVVAVKCARNRAYVAVGWFWYLGTLVPVIGLVQVGGQAMADRYTYVPLIGVFICVVWGIHEWVKHRPLWQTTGVVAGSMILAGYAVMAAAQVRHWRNSETLFQHALRATPDNPVAHNSLGEALLQRGELAGAIQHFEAAARLAPLNPTAYFFLGSAFIIQGDCEQAVGQFQTALQLKPDYAQAHLGLGQALGLQQKYPEAEAHFREAIRLKSPNPTVAWGQLGKILAMTGRGEEANACFREMLRLAPNNDEAHYYFARALAFQNRVPEARHHFQEALRLHPDFAEAHKDFASFLMAQGEVELALEHYARAAALKRDAETEFLLANALIRRNDTTRAVAHLRTALKLQPDHAAALNDLAWLLAAGASEAIRDVAEAVPLAERACELTSGKNARFLDTLATVYAAAGRLPEAISTAQAAVSVALADGERLLANEIQQRIVSYQGRLAKQDSRR